MTDPLLTAKDLARHLGVDENTVYRWSRVGRIPALKVGRWWRFRVEEVEGALAREPREWHDLSGPLGAALERGDHVVAYDIRPGLARRLEQAFVTAGLRRGAIIAPVVRGTDDAHRTRALARAVSGDDGRVVALDASSVPVGRAEWALQEWASRVRRRSGGKRDIWIYGSPPPPSVDPRISRLEAALMKLAPGEGWTVLCLYDRSALADRARLADVHTGEVAASSDEVRVLVARR